MKFYLYLSLLVIIIFLLIGCSPSNLRSASRQGDTTAVNSFLTEGADPNAENFLGITPLIYAASNGHAEIVQILIDGGADVNSQSESGISSLIAAAKEGHTDTVSVLLNNGADINLSSDRGKTALIEAASEGHLAIVQLLLNAGADTSKKDILGGTALNLAETEQIAETIRNNVDTESVKPANPKEESSQSTDTSQVSEKEARSNLFKNVLSASLMALSFILLSHWPAMTRLMFPFYKRGDCTKAGFLPFGRVMKSYPSSAAGVAYSRFILPLFVTIYIAFLIVFESQTSNSNLDGSNDLHFMVGMWAFVMLVTGPTISILLFVVIPFFIVYFLTNSMYWGCFATALLLAIVYAYSHEEHYIYNLVSSRVKYDSKMRLDGSSSILIRLFSKIDYISRIVIPLLILIFMFIVIMRLISNSNFSMSQFTLLYADSTTESLITLLPITIIYINISLRLFSGGIFNYLQVDFLKVLGERLRFSKDNVGEFNEQENSINEQIKTSSEYNGPLIAATDRMYQVKQIPMSNFRTAISFYSLDIILTLSALFSFPLIPGTTVENISTLSAIIKIPIYLLFIFTSLRRFQTWFTAKTNIGINSVTFREEIQNELDFQASLKDLLKDIMEQQIAQMNRYIDIPNNKYLLSLAGTSERNRRIHL